MAKLTDGERLVALETKMDIVIDQQKEMNAKLDATLPTFVTVAQHDADITALKKRTWVQNTLSAIMGVILTLLLTYFIAGITKGH